MSTSLLYHGFGLVGYRYLAQEYREGQVTFRIEQAREQLRCPHCHGNNVWRQGAVERTFRTIPIGCKPVQLRFEVPRVLCFECGLTRQVKLGFAQGPRIKLTPFFRGGVDKVKW